MVHKIRSLLAHKIVATLQTLSNNGREVKATSVLPYIRVNTHTSQPPEFKLSLRDLQQNHIIHCEGLRSLGRFGSSVVESFETDQEVPAVYVHQSKTDVRLNFKVSLNPFVSEVVGTIVEQPQDFWRCSELVHLVPPQRVVVEYSSPNIAKPFHVGHLRSTIIGNFVANINAAFGHRVTRLNYLGDWGTQFGLLKYGYDHQNMTETNLQENAITKLHQAYVWANQRAEEDPTVTQTARETFTRMEEGDSGELRTWEMFRKVSIAELNRIYDRLNVRFDAYHGESMYSKRSCEEVLKDMQDAGLVRTAEDGRKMYQVSTGHQVTLEKSDGSSLYLTRDVAAAVDRLRRFDFTRMFYVVENGQSDHFTALFSILRAMGYHWAEGLAHVKFGRVKGMSSRRGTAVALEDLLDGAKRLMAKRQLLTKTTRTEGSISSIQTAEELAVSSVIVRDMKQRRQKDYEFSWDKALQATGDTGVKLQYLHCRLVSLEEKCGVRLEEGVSTAPLTEPAALTLVQEIARFDEVLVEAYQELEACILLAYLFRLCSVTNQAIKHLQVKGVSHDLAQARLSLFMAARHTLSAGMNILGLTPMKRM